MTTRNRRAERRPDGLSKERIVRAAIEILDSGGEDALTFRALAARLATGAGAIYWHIADKDDLLAAAAYEIVAEVLTGVPAATPPREAIRAVALGLFDAIDAHPWVGTQLSRDPAQLWREPGQSALLQVFESVGGRLLALGVREPVLFVAASALVNYVFGAAGQNASNARLVPPGTDRAAVLAAVAARWASLDPAAYPFVRQVAGPLREHDDRAQFLAGVDLILAGMPRAD